MQAALGRAYPRRDGIRFGVSVAQNFQKVDEIGILLRLQLEIADLTIGLVRRSALGGRDSGNVLDVVDDLLRRKERIVAERRAFPEAGRTDSRIGGRLHDSSAIN
jgi:hypothetical protein